MAVRACRFCGTRYQEKDQRCPSCGSAEFLNVCENCGKAFDGAFCPVCGVRSGQKKKICPECRSGYFSHACPNCGYSPDRKPEAKPVVQKVIHEHVYVPAPERNASSAVVRSAPSDPGTRRAVAVFLAVVFVLLGLGVWWLSVPANTVREDKVRKAVQTAMSDCFVSPTVRVSRKGLGSYSVTVSGRFKFTDELTRGIDAVEKVRSALRYKVPWDIRPAIGSVTVAIPHSARVQEELIHGAPEWYSEDAFPPAVLWIEDLSAL